MIISYLLDCKPTQARGKALEQKAPRMNAGDVLTIASSITALVTCFFLLVAGSRLPNCGILSEFGLTVLAGSSALFTLVGLAISYFIEKREKAQQKQLKEIADQAGRVLAPKPSPQIAERANQGQRSAPNDQETMRLPKRAPLSQENRAKYFAWRARIRSFKQIRERHLPQLRAINTLFESIQPVAIPNFEGRLDDLESRVTLLAQELKIRDDAESGLITAGRRIDESRSPEEIDAWTREADALNQRFSDLDNQAEQITQLITQCKQSWDAEKVLRDQMKAEGLLLSREGNKNLKKLGADLLRLANDATRSLDVINQDYQQVTRKIANVKRIIDPERERRNQLLRIGSRLSTDADSRLSELGGRITALATDPRLLQEIEVDYQKIVTSFSAIRREIKTAKAERQAKIQAEVREKRAASDANEARVQAQRQRAISFMTGAGPQFQAKARLLMTATQASVVIPALMLDGQAPPTQSAEPTYDSEQPLHVLSRQFSDLGSELTTLVQSSSDLDVTKRAFAQRLESANKSLGSQCATLLTVAEGKITSLKAREDKASRIEEYYHNVAIANLNRKKCEVLYLNKKLSDKIAAASQFKNQKYSTFQTNVIQTFNAEYGTANALQDETKKAEALAVAYEKMGRNLYYILDLLENDQTTDPNQASMSWGEMISNAWSGLTASLADSVNEFAETVAMELGNRESLSVEARNMLTAQEVYAAKVTEYNAILTDYKAFQKNPDWMRGDLLAARNELNALNEALGSLEAICRRPIC